jgi:hypothetical protein
MVMQLKNDKSIKYGVFKHITKDQLVNYLISMLNDQTTLRSPYYSCGPTSAVYVAATHDPEQFVRVFIDLWKTGSANDGDIEAPQNLKDFNYSDASWIGVALIGALRASENEWLDSGYDPIKKDESSKRRNGTAPLEYPDLLERLGVSVSIKTTRSATFDELMSWTGQGKRLVLFGYMSLLEGGGDPSDDDRNYFGGDHFVTIHSITVDKKTSKVIVKYWDHGEKKNHRLRNWVFKNREDFMKAISRSYFLTNTGNPKEEAKPSTQNRKKHK